MEFLANMTSEDGRGLSSIRQSYLSAEIGLLTGNKAVLVLATNHMDRFRNLFGKIGANYHKLAITPAQA